MSTTHNTVSIICSVFRSQYLADMIDSVLAQTYPDIELILRLDGPPQEEITAIKKMLSSYTDPRIKMIEGPNLGVDNSRKCIIDTLTTPYFLVIDDDDLLEKDCIERLHKVMKADPTLGIVQGSMQVFGDVSVDLPPIRRQNFRGFTPDMFSGNQPYMIRKKYYDLTSGWTPAPEIFNSGAENDMFLKLEEISGIGYADDVLYYRRLHPTNSSLWYLHTEKGLRYARRMIQEQLVRRHLSWELLSIVRDPEARSSFENVTYHFQDLATGEKFSCTTRLYNFSTRIEKLDTPFFSVQCPAFHLDDLSTMIDSVRAQTYPHWELLICSDAPPNKEHLQKIMERYTADQRIRFYSSEQNRGPGPTRQFLLEQSSAAYIIPIDSDDHIAPSLLSEFAQELKKGGDFSLIRAGMRLYNEIMSIDIIPKPRTMKHGLTVDLYNVHQPYLINARYLRQVGGWHWDNGSMIKTGEDTDLFMRLETRAPVRIIPKILYFKRQHPMSVMGQLTGEHGRTHFVAMVKDMITHRKLPMTIRNCTVRYIDDKNVRFTLYVQSPGTFARYRSLVPTITPIERFKRGAQIPTKDILDIFGLDDISWRALFLYPNNNALYQIPRPDLLEQLHSSPMAYDKKERFFASLKKHHYPTGVNAHIDIILPVHNNARQTQRCILSLYRHTHHLFRLIIVDDGSTEKRLARFLTLMKRRAHNILILRNDVRLGHTASVNRGLVHSVSPYITVLDNDTVVSSDWLNKLLVGFECDPSIGIIGPRLSHIAEQVLLNERNNALQRSAGDEFSEVPFLYGSCMLIKKSVVDQCGGLNPIFGEGSYYDDLDLSFRARHNGFKLVVSNATEIYHEGLMTTKQVYPAPLEILRNNYQHFKDLWAAHPLFKFVPEELRFADRADAPKRRSETPVASSAERELNLAFFKIDQYDHVSHEVTDKDNKEYFSHYFKVIDIKYDPVTDPLETFFEKLIAEKVDYVFLNGTFDPASLFKYRNERGLPIRFLLWPYVFTPWQDRYLRLASLFRPGDHVFALSEFVSRSFQRISLNFNCLPLPCMIDRKSFPAPHKDKNILTLIYCGRPLPEKGLRELCQALPKATFDWRLDVICPINGLSTIEQDYLSDVQKLINVTGSISQITFHGDLREQQTKKKELLARADVLVYLSRYPGETFGRAIIEGMAGGCAVLTYDRAPMNELVRNDVNGILLELPQQDTIDPARILTALTHLSERTFLQKIQTENLKISERFDHTQALPDVRRILVTALEHAQTSPLDQELLTSIQKLQQAQQVELGICCNTIDDLSRISAQLSYTHIYIGPEFCENLMPTQKDVETILGYAAAHQKKTVLMTPFCTDAGLKNITVLLPLLPKKSEVVVNDWGVLSLVKAQGLTPVLGRLLIKTKRDPRISPHDPQQDYFRSSNLTNKDFQKFLHEQGIARVELDNIVQGYPDDMLAGNIKASLYLPFVYISTTRKCLAPLLTHDVRRDVGNNFSPDPITTNCARECEHIEASTRIRNYDRPIIIKGNTQFYRNDVLPKDLQTLGIDRIVYTP